MDRKEAVTILQEKRDLARMLEAAEKSADWAAKDRVDSSSLRASQHGRYADALDMAISALSPPNEPLTIEQLREMDGEPVYMTFPSDTGNQCGHWALVGTQRWGAVSLIYGCGWSSYESAVETLGAKFYRRPPEGEEHCYG